MICRLLNFRIIESGLAITLLMFWLLKWGIVPAGAAEAHIAVASNFRATALKIAEHLEQYSSHNYQLITGSTGKLTGQIINGAPFDVFMAADQRRPRLLIERGFAEAASFQVYVEGQLGLWWPNGPEGFDLESLSVLEPQQVCIANPAFAPYGEAANELVLAAGFNPKWLAKTIRVDNVTVVTAMVAQGHVRAGFVARAAMLAAARQSRFSVDERDILWLVGYPPVLQGMVMLERGRKNPAAVYWIEQMNSIAIQELLLRDGYDLPKGDG